MALNALRHLPRGSLDRMVLLTGASFCGNVLDLLETPAGRSVDILNVTSRENDIFDAAFERLVGSDRPGDCAIGQGIQSERVVNLQLDCPETLAALHRFGFAVGASERRICHWSSYRREGVMAFYRSFLQGQTELSLTRLKQALPDQIHPRWSRIFAMPQVSLPAPLATCLRSTLRLTPVGRAKGALAPR
jgi:hypothetical protein